MIHRHPVTTYPKGLFEDPMLAWKQLTFFQRHPDIKMLLAEAIGIALILCAIRI